MLAARRQCQTMLGGQRCAFSTSRYRHLGRSNRFRSTPTRAQCGCERNMGFSVLRPQGNCPS